MTDPPSRDRRAARVQQGAVAVLLLGGFVFRAPWLVLLTAALLAVDVTLGRRGPSARVTGAGRAPAAPDRFQGALETLVLLVAALVTAAGWGGLGWLLTLVVALVAALAATTPISVGAELHRRWRR